MAKRCDPEGGNEPFHCEMKEGTSCKDKCDYCVRFNEEMREAKKKARGRYEVDPSTILDGQCTCPDALVAQERARKRREAAYGDYDRKSEPGMDFWELDGTCATARRNLDVCPGQAWSTSWSRTSRTALTGMTRMMRSRKAASRPSARRSERAAARRNDLAWQRSPPSLPSQEPRRRAGSPCQEGRGL